MSTSTYRTRFPLPTPIIQDSFGVNIHFVDWNLNQIATMAAVGIKWVRMDCLWYMIEQTAGVYDFSHYDKLVAELVKNNMRPLFIVCYGNPLYLSEAQRNDAVATGTNTRDYPPDTPETQAAFIKFSVALIQHYKERGFLWELWNEPNLDQFWHPKSDVNAYATLAIAWAAAIRKVSYFEWLGGPACSTFDWPWLENLCKSGVLQYFDFFSVHAYRDVRPATVADDWTRLRAMINKYKPSWKRVQMLSGEWGYSELRFNPPVSPSPYQAIDVRGNVIVPITPAPVSTSVATPAYNILSGTNDLDTDLWGGYWIKPKTTRVLDPVGGKNAFQLESADTQQDPKYYSGLAFQGSAIPGTYYTASAWLRSTSGKMYVTLGVDDFQTWGSGTRVVQIDETWQRYSVTFQINNKTHSLFQVHEHMQNNPAWQVAFPQVEVIHPDTSTWDASFKELQAEYLLEMYQANMASGVIMSIWYDWQDDDSLSTNPDFRMGLIKSDGTTKPAYNKLKVLTDTLNTWSKFLKK